MYFYFKFCFRMSSLEGNKKPSTFDSKVMDSSLETKETNTLAAKKFVFSGSILGGLLQQENRYTF